MTMAEATIEEIAGFISGNVKRKQIVDVLAKNGSETLESLRKITRMPKLMLEKGLKDMAEKGAITKENDRFTLTEAGKAAASMLPKQSTKGGGHRFESNVQREI
jgi:predicted transcriptional regulator